MAFRFLFVVLALVPIAGCSGKTLSKDGGVVLVYAVAEKSDATPATVAMAVRQRLGQLVPRGQLQVRELGDDQVEVTLIGLSDEEVETAKKALRARGELEFRIVALRGKEDELIAAAEADEPAGDKDEPFARWVNFDPERCPMPEKAVTMKQDGQHRVLVIDDEFDVTAELLKSARPALMANGWQIDAELNPQGGAVMQQLTKRNLPVAGEHRQLAIVFDGEALSAPRLTSEISHRFNITGQFSESEARFIVAVLKAGQFPMRLKPEPVSEMKVPPKN